jgi:REP element-mobilizing transposase RayT
MPRHARLDATGALHHVIIRGIDRSTLFADDSDRQRFVDKLGEYVSATGCSLYAWVLMSTHVHLLLKSGNCGLSGTMRKLLTWYALYFNKRHGRTGHLFQNRYKSILCEEERYFLALVRYIHLNPVRAGIVTDMRSLDHYRWCGHAVLVGRHSGSFMDTHYVLKQFSNDENSAMKAYRRFVGEGIALGPNPELTGGGLIRSSGGWSQVISARRRKETIKGDERILGDGNFVLTVISETEKRQTRQLRYPNPEIRIEGIIREECRRGRVSVAELESGVRRRNVTAVRETIALRCARELGLSAAEIARHAGVNTSAITKAIERAGEKLRQGGTQ